MNDPLGYSFAFYDIAEAHFRTLSHIYFELSRFLEFRETSLLRIYILFSKHSLVVIVEVTCKSYSNNTYIFFSTHLFPMPSFPKLWSFLIFF